jgi:hypothetical protein
LRKSRTVTDPSVTLTVEPLQVSIVCHAVPLIAADA